MSRRRFAPVAISLAVTCGLFLAGEAWVRSAGIQPMEWPTAEGNLHFPGVRIDPLLGPTLRPEWEGQWPGRFAVRSDGRGFRATPYAPPAPAHARIAFLGDSCTFGWGMDTPDTFVAQLDAHQRATGMAAIDFMNAAYPGQSAVFGPHVLERQVAGFRPDVVVITFSANNAFRFSAVSDRERFRFYRLRELVLRSRLMQIAAAWLANRAAPPGNPRRRNVVEDIPAREWERVAGPNEFEAALRAMVADTRALGATPVFLILPRASAVSDAFGWEDAGSSVSWPPPRQLNGNDKPNRIELGLLEMSCLDPRTLAQPLTALYEHRGVWLPVLPQDPQLRALLPRGAAAYIAGDLTAARQQFKTAVSQYPNAPLAHYDLGATRLTMGDRDGLRDLAEADRLACNVFLQYQIILWRVATEQNVAVVDITLSFQAHDGEPLFIDTAHPNRTGHRLIAEALWPVLETILERRPRTS